METRAAVRHSANSHTHTADPLIGGFPLAGPSDLPDPTTHAYRQDLADAALAGRVIASHYADPLERQVTAPADLFADCEGGSPPLTKLKAGDTLLMLDNSRGWAWGYAGPDRLVGYVRSDAISA